MTLSQYRSQLSRAVATRRISRSRANQLWQAASRRRVTGLQRPLVSNRSRVQDSPTQIVTRALGPLIPGPVAQIANLVDTLPLPIQALLPIFTPSEIVKVGGAIVDAASAVGGFIGGLFSGGGYTQAELNRNHAIVMAGMLPQPEEPGPSRRTLEF